MDMPKSVKLTYINSMTVALRTDDSATLTSLMSVCMAKYGSANATACYKCAVIAVNAKPYTFTDFSPQVISRSDDKSSVRCEGQSLGHNED